MWDLWLDGERRVGRHEDGIPDKQRTVVLPARGRAQPYYTVDDNLSVRVGPPAASKPAARAPQPGVLRERVIRPLAITAHRLGARVIQALVRPGKADGFDGVRILLMHAYGMGGTIRTLPDARRAPRRPRTAVEVISIVRSRDEPFFAFPDGVAVTTLDDRRKGAPRAEPVRARPGRSCPACSSTPTTTPTRSSACSPTCGCCAACARCARASWSRRGRASTCLPRATRRRS